MAMLTDDRLAAELRTHTATLAGIVTADLNQPVPSCPGWTFRQLATHVGRGHRWAAEMVTTRATEDLPMDQVPDGKLPAGPVAQAAWLNTSADLVVGAVAAAAGEQVWTFLGRRPARFWLRRRAHEAAVHLADAQLASGHGIELAPDFAADGIGEWLEMAAASPQAVTALARERRDNAGGDGQVLHFHATDPGLNGAGEWLVRRTPSGVTAEPGHVKADVAVRGPAARLLLVLTGRLPASDPAVEVLGDKELFLRWLEHTPLR
jgi:uncharacterized protein (TIGR03083 family)